MARSRNEVFKALPGFTGKYFEVWFSNSVSVNNELFVTDLSITHADTIDIVLKREKEDGTPLMDIAGWILMISFSNSLTCLEVGNPDLVEIPIYPLAPSTDAVFSGTIPDDALLGLAPGPVYCSAKLIDPNSRVDVIDMVTTRLNRCVSNRVA